MNNEKSYFFDKPKNIKRLLYLLYGSCALLLALDFVIHRHLAHRWENLWGFYPLYGFIGCVVLVLVASWMRTFLMRPEDYYAEDSKADSDENAVTDKDSRVVLTQKNKSGGSNVDA